MEKSRAELLIAAQADPADPQPHFLLAQIYREQGDSESRAREMKEFERLSLAEKTKTYQSAKAAPQ